MFTDTVTRLSTLFDWLASHRCPQPSRSDCERRP